LVNLLVQVREEVVKKMKVVGVLRWEEKMKVVVLLRWEEKIKVAEVLR
jgi:hypothetical protein